MTSANMELLLLKNQVCFPVYALSREITNQYRPLLERLDISYPQYLVLIVLWENDQQTVSGIGDKLLLDTGTLTPLLKRMEVKGLITRTRSKTDERVVVITLTTKGKNLKKKAITVPEGLLSNMHISLEELNQLRNITNKILNKTTQK